MTPDKLRRRDGEPLFAACDEALRAVVGALVPRLVVGVGAFAEGRAREALAAVGVEAEGFRVGRIPHPSPASPAANRGWAPQAEAALERLGLSLCR